MKYCTRTIAGVGQCEDTGERHRGQSFGFRGQGRGREMDIHPGGGSLPVLHLPVYNYEDQYKDHKYTHHHSYGQHKD